MTASVAGPRRLVPGIAALLFVTLPGACTRTSDDKSPDRQLLAFADWGDLFDLRSAKTTIPADRRRS